MPAPRMGARNSVMHQAETLAGGTGLPMEMGALYAGGRLPVWRPAGPGARWRLTIPVAEEGDFRVHFVARLDAEGPTVGVEWDGDEMELTNGSATVELYRPHRVLLRNFTLPTQHLTSGNHTLEFTYMEADPSVARSGMGLDFVWVQKIG